MRWRWSVGGGQLGLWLFEPFGSFEFFGYFFGNWRFGRASARFLIFAMARYEHLPIYKAALDLTVHLEKLVAGFSRHHKYTLGTEMREGDVKIDRLLPFSRTPCQSNSEHVPCGSLRKYGGHHPSE